MANCTSALAAYVLRLHAQLASTRDELNSAKYNVSYYQELYHTAFRIRTIESVRREGMTTYETIETLTHGREQ
jgi:hypothetical protein